MKYFLITLALVFSLVANAQTQSQGNGGTYLGEYNPADPRQHWGIDLKMQDPEEAEESERKAWKRINMPKTQAEPARHGRSSLTAAKGHQFAGQDYYGSTPSDNSIAISNRGHIVSCINSRVNFYDTTGNPLGSQFLSDFGAGMVTASCFDPRVTYDPLDDRFYLVFMSGSTGATSRLLLSVSSSGDATKPWKTYDFKPQNLQSTQWMDYPNIGTSAADVFVGINIINTGTNNLAKAQVFQLRKAELLAGQTPAYLVWNQPMDTLGELVESPFPAQHGQGQTAGSGICLVSTQRGGGVYFQLTRITADYGNNPALKVDTFHCPPYTYGVGATMRGAHPSESLSVGDCRVKSAFVLDSTLHFAFVLQGNSGNSAIRYCRFSLRSHTLQSVLYDSSFHWVSYPAIASFAITETDPSVVMVFTSTSKTVYPDCRFVTIDRDLNVSAPTVMHSGDTYFNVINGTDERWGDYSGAARFHSKTCPSVWLFASFGKLVAGNPNTKREIGNFICEATNCSPVGIRQPLHQAQPLSIYPNPLSTTEFTLQLTLPQTGEYTVQLYDAGSRLVKKILQQTLPAGNATLRFQTEPLAAGAYLLTIQHNGTVLQTAKVVK